MISDMLGVRSHVDSNNKSDICCSFRNVRNLFFIKLRFEKNFSQTKYTGGKKIQTPRKN